jgi:hypothetical protein
MFGHCKQEIVIIINGPSPAFPVSVLKLSWEILYSDRYIVQS